MKNRNIKFSEQYKQFRAIGTKKDKRLKGTKSFNTCTKIGGVANTQKKLRGEISLEKIEKTFFSKVDRAIQKDSIKAFKSNRAKVQNETRKAKRKK